MKLVLRKHLALPSPVLDLTFAVGANRLIVTREGERALILDASTGREIAGLPKGAGVGPVDPAGTLAVVGEDGKRVAGRSTSNVSLWDLAKGKKRALLAKNHPGDDLAPQAIGATRVLGIRQRKDAYSICLFDHAGKKLVEHALGKVPLPFHGALSADERVVVHATFTGAAQLVDTASGKAQKLAGGVLRIGRDHDKGISSLAFDSSGEHVSYISHGTETVHVWNVRTRKSLAGTWVGERVQDAFFSGGSLVVVSSGTREATAKIHSLATKAKPRVVIVGHGSLLFAAAGDDRHLACVGFTGWDAYAKSGLEIYDLVSGKRAARIALPGPMKTACSVAACPGKVAVGDLAGGIALFFA